ncbi:MAG: formylglycine-generating enzyme family protein, partial [Planctomycetaceae bacterium]
AAKGVPQWTIPVPQIETLIEQYQGAQKSNDQTYTTAVNATNQLLNSSGLLLPRENFAAGFYHATIQDFLAAQRLWSGFGRDPARLDQFFRERAPQHEWRGTLTFLMGWQIQAQGDEVEESFELLTRLIRGLKPQDVGLGVVIGQCLQILSKRGRDLKDAGVLETYRQFCKDRIAEAVQPLRDRYELGLALGAVGDDRIRVNLKDCQDKTGFVRIPDGTYWVGDREQDSDIDFVMKSDLWLTQYPITNSQFAEFIHDGGYTTPTLWSPDGGQQWLQQTKSIAPRWWHDVKWNAPNKPVVGVTWYEADAFARWAGGRLPTEWEWEAAARGRQGCIYPWGDQWRDGICNSDVAGLGTTSPVGLFPKSRTRETGLEDMAGNVWEWCKNWFDEAASYRVVRGGSWFSDAARCRSAYRNRLVPDYRDYRLGFRVALSSIPAAQPPS